MRAVFLIALVILGGCTVGPTYRPPTPALPSSYEEPHSNGSSEADIADWWRAFDDPVLNDLIARARSGNLDVRQAATRIAEARAQEQETRAEDGPTVNASAQGGYSQLSSNSLPSALANLGSFNNSGTSSGPGLGLAGERFATFQTGFDTSWELDLFGGQRRAQEGAGARVDAAIWSERDTEVTLVAEVANTYQQYRALQRRIVLSDRTIAIERDRLDFIRVRAGNGLVTTLDERRQQQDVDQRLAARQDLAAQADTHLHALSVLLGLAPVALRQELATPPATDPVIVDVPVGLPSDLLERRPDVRAAERRLAAATADIGVAEADLYPKFSLTGALQLASRSLSNLIESDSILANGAGRLSVPIIGRGVALATVRLRRRQTDEALTTYQSNVLTALRDVEDALTRLDADRQRIAQLRASTDAAQDAADTTEVRYRHGLIAFTEVLDAQNTELSARDTLIQAQAAAAQDMIALYKALGGGWDERRIATQKEG